VLGFAYESEREGLAARMQQIVKDQQAAPPIEIPIRRLDGSSLWVEVQGVPVIFSGEPAIQSVLHDVTERRRLREESDARMSRVQRQSATLLQLATHERTRWHSQQARLDEICVHTRDALRTSHAAIWLLRHKVFRVVSQGRQRSADAKQLTEADTQSLSAALDRERVINVRDIGSDPLGRVFAAAEPRARSLLAAAIRRSGELTGVLVCVNAHDARDWFADETQFVAAVADQIAQLLIDSEREQALADLRTLTGELMRLQDEERRRIGRDLHDSTGQTLAALEISLARLAAATAGMLPEREELLEECSRLASQCSAEIRTASYLLHPPLLDELGLASALRWLADGIQARSGMEVRLELPASMPRLPRQTELTLFRVAQEALTNVHRHAASPWVAVRLTQRVDAVVLEIEDAGRGIRRAHAGDSAVVLGVGLAGMRERIRQVGGTFVVDADGSGTVVRATLPLERADSGRGAQV
jgi:signal transduction histidine kinase